MPLQADKEAAEANADMLTKQFKVLLEDKKKVAAEKQELEAHVSRLQERLEYFECTVGHSGDHVDDCEAEHDQLHGYAIVLEFSEAFIGRLCLV